MRHHRRKLSAPTRRRQSPATAPLLVLLAGTLSCGAGDADHRAGPESPPGGAGPAEETSAPAPGVALGVDVLFRDSVHLVRGRRVGLITNHTGVSWEGDSAISTIDRLASDPEAELVALYSPEHGIRGRAEAGEAVASDVDPATGVPIHSLYGDTRRPTRAMLDGVDVLLFDIQDIGTRYYTYVWTMALAMEAAGEAGIPFVVLDRPNPLGGRLIQGNVLDPQFASFVGLYPVPMRHGLTAGELARFLVAEHGVEVELRVVPMDGWSRAMWYDDTGLPFIPPSPNMPSLASATHYPGTCLFEGTNLSVGRGTDRAFQQFGAPWLDAEAIARELNGGAYPGVRFEPVTFTPRSPGDGKFADTPVRGIRLVVTDRERYDPARAAVGALLAIHRAHADSLAWRVDHFDRLAGTDRLRTRILDHADLSAITATWASERGVYADVVKAYVLYP